MKKCVFNDDYPTHTHTHMYIYIYIYIYIQQFKCDNDVSLGRTKLFELYNSNFGMSD